jgi:hypothetical protein
MFHNASHIYGIPERPFIRYISSKTFETNTCPQTYFGLKCMNMSLLNKTCAYGLHAMILLAGNGVKGNHPVPVRVVADKLDGHRSLSRHDPEQTDQGRDG